MTVENKQNRAPHLNKNEADGVERELRELQGLVLRMSDEVERRLNFNSICFGIIIGILVGIFVELGAI